MIKVTRLNGDRFYINPDLVEFLEETPDTIVSLTTGKKFVIRESAGETLELIVRFKRRIFSGLPEIKAPETMGEHAGDADYYGGTQR